MYLCVSGVSFPKTYMTVCKKILTRLFRIFVHVYIHHFDKIVSIGAVKKKLCFSDEFWELKPFKTMDCLQEAHVNTCYKHFYFFVTGLKLVDPKELEPLVRQN